MVVTAHVARADGQGVAAMTYALLQYGPETEMMSLPKEAAGQLHGACRASTARGGH